MVLKIAPVTIVLNIFQVQDAFTEDKVTIGMGDTTGNTKIWPKVKISIISETRCNFKLFSKNVWFIRAQEPIGSSDLLWSRVVRRPSVVRPSVRRPLNYLHFRLLLQNRLMDFDETWYGWSAQGPLQVLLFFGQIRRGADPGRGKNRSRGVPFFKKLLLQSWRLQQQTECIAVI